MVHLITQISKYLLIFLFVLYTWYSYSALRDVDDEKRSQILKRQTACMILIHLDAFLVLFAVTMEVKILVFYAAQLMFILFLFLIYKVIYKYASRLLVNNMCMLMIIGFIILTRLDFSQAMKQFEIAVAAAVVSIFIPQLVRKFKALRKFTWVYAVIGVLALGAVLVLGRVSGGAHLSFSVAGITLQPSEFIKILFVFFVACMFAKSTNFKQVCVTTIVAILHVGILVVSTDLGAALIFFISYIIMLYVSTRKITYLLAGVGVGVVAALAAAKLFSHVQTRIAAWQDPFASIHGGGYQIAQSLFAIGTGSWFGMGLYQGKPDTIPVGESDFVFSAVCEEMGIVFGICIILVCFGCFLAILNIAMQINDFFYKLIALGLGCVYGVQVFLNIGGVIKCIPSTGVTLPLISYGGSSILCTIVTFAIIQGLYILRHDEGDLDEQGNQTRSGKKNQPGAGQYRGSGSEPGRYREPQQTSRSREQYREPQQTNRNREQYREPQQTGRSGQQYREGDPFKRQQTKVSGRTGAQQRRTADPERGRAQEEYLRNAEESGRAGRKKKRSSSEIEEIW